MNDDSLLDLQEQAENELGNETRQKAMQRQKDKIKEHLI